MAPHKEQKRQASLEELNTLLRGEISAAETYKSAMDKLDEDNHADQRRALHDLQRDHGRAAQELRSRVEALGGDADSSSGAWGVWAKTIQKTANLMGDPAALKALREGEKNGLTTYEQALRDEKLDDVSAQLIRDDLIPAQHDHLAHLDRLIASVS